MHSKISRVAGPETPPPFESHSHHPSDVPLPFPTSHLSVTLTFFNANMRIPSNHWIGISVTTPNFININIINSATELSFSTSPVEWPSNRYDRPSILAEWLFEDFMTYKGRPVRILGLRSALTLGWMPS